MDDEKKKSITLFGSKKEIPKGPGISDALTQLNEVASRVSLLEDRITNLTRRMQVSDNNILGMRKRSDDEFKAINSELIEVKRSITELNNKVELIIKELKTRAGKEDVELVRKYISMWEPLNFVTRAEVERLIANMLGKKEA